MATNSIREFGASAVGIHDLATYDTLRAAGHVPGIADYQLENKVLRQTSKLASALAEFIAAGQSVNIDDTLTVENIATYLSDALKATGLPKAAAGGTANAITATYTPAVALVNGTTVLLEAASANSTTTPTFSANGLTAKTIVKASNSAVAAGDIAGSGHWVLLTYDASLDKWVLGNPAVTATTPPDASTTVKGLVELAVDAEAQALASALLAITPSTLNSAFKGANQSLSASGHQKLPGGLIFQWVIGSSQTVPLLDFVSTSLTLPITFPTANIGIFPVSRRTSGAYLYMTEASRTLSTAVVNSVNVSTAASGVHVPVVFAIGY